MAAEGEGNIKNTRKRKSTEPISDSNADEKGTNKADNTSDGPPKEKLLKSNEEAYPTKDEQQSISAVISQPSSNSGSKLNSQEDANESLASLPDAANQSNADFIDTIPEVTQIQRDNEITDMNDSKSRSIENDTTIDNLNGEEDIDNEGNITTADEGILDIPDNTDDIVKQVDAIFDDDIIILDDSGSTSILKPDESIKQILTISFASEEGFENYANEFLAFCNTYSEFRVSQDVNNLTLNITQDSSVLNNHKKQWQSIDNEDLNVDLSPNNQKKKQSKVKKELFTLDATPSVSTSGSGCQYNSKFAVITTEPKSEIKTNSVKKHNLSMCFNCDGSHALRDCTLPRDHQKINKARNSFQKKFSQTNRYHDDEEQKYSYLAPGSISASLRMALGMRDREIPPYVYCMRIFGYPPGWIEEATEYGSSMAVFGIDGKVEDTGKGGSRFNAAKMIKYAGFNVKMDKGVRDEWEKNNVPPFSKEQSMDAMLNYIRNMESTLNDNKEVCDMDVDKEEEGHEGEEVAHVPPPGCEDECSSNDTKTSLGDLETQKQQLLAELNESSQSQDNSQDTEQIPTNNSESNSTQNTSLDANKTLESNVSCPEHSTPSNKLKVSEFGTPIIKSASPYSQLPNPENFSVGVSDIINFENLPNSTGAYQKITGLISRVRETLKSLQDPSST